MNKPAPTTHPIHPLLAERWSPTAFADRPVDPAVLARLLEAARWAPSCFNEQPWAFVVGTRGDGGGFERLASCLVEGNAWAREASVLVLSVAKLAFARNGRPNRHAWHDVGLAVGNLAVQAQAEGLRVHQMGGFDAGRARLVLGIPEGHEPVAMIAIGHPVEAGEVPEGLRAREEAPRSRREVASFAFGGAWGEPLAGSA